MVNVKTAKLKKKIYVMECRTILVKLLKQHVIIIKKSGKNIRISVKIAHATSLIA